MSEPQKNYSHCGIFYGWHVAVAGTLVLFLTIGSLGGALPIFNKTLEEKEGWDLFWIVMGFVAFLLGAGVGSPVVGILVERFGPRRVMSVGTSLMAISVLLMAAMQNTVHYLAIMLFLGIAVAATSIVPVQKLITNWFVANRGAAMGVAMSGGPIGTAIMAIVISLLMPAVGWRITFIIYVILLLLLMTPLLLITIRNKPKDIGMDALGVDQSTLFTTEAEEDAEQDQTSNLLKTVFSPGFLFLVFIVLLCSLGTGAPPVHFAFIAGDQGFREVLVGIVIAVFAVGNIIGTLFFGWLADRMNKSLVIGAVSLLASISVAAMLIYGFYWLLLTAALIFGLCWGGLFALWPTLLAERFGTRNFAALMGIVSVAVIIGWAVAPLIAAIERSATGAYTFSLGGFAMLLFVAAVLITFFRTAKS